MTLPAGTYAPASITYLDAGNEVSSLSLYGKVITAGTFVADTASFATLITKTNDITLGVNIRHAYGNEVIIGGVQPTNGAARETKLLVQYQDVTTGERYTTTVPTLDPAIPSYVQNINAKDVVRLDEPPAIADFKAAFEGFAHAPRTGNSITVVGLKVVGRNI
jgi:hypothetical protein